LRISHGAVVKLRAGQRVDISGQNNKISCIHGLCNPRRNAGGLRRYAQATE